MQIHYAGKLSKDDYLKALLLHNAHLRLQRWFFGAVLVLIVLSIVFLGIQSPGKLAELARIFSNAYPFLFLGLLFMTYPWWTPYWQSMSYDQKGNIYRENVFGTITETQITINGGSVQATFQWSGYLDYKLANDMLLIYRGQNNFNVFIRSMFSNQEEWERFLALTKDQVAKNKKRG